MNTITDIKRAKEVEHINKISAPVVSIFDKRYMKRAHADEQRKRAHEQRVAASYKKVRAYEKSMEKDWKRTRATFVVLAVLTVATALANMFGMWGGFFG